MIILIRKLKAIDSIDLYRILAMAETRDNGKTSPIEFD